MMSCDNALSKMWILLTLYAEGKIWDGTSARGGCSQHMRLPIRLSYTVSAKRLDWRRPHVRNAIALLGVALFFVALDFFGPKLLQFGIHYNASEIREAPSKLVLPDVWLP
jgi:hypothetical protein